MSSISSTTNVRRTPTGTLPVPRIPPDSGALGKQGDNKEQERENNAALNAAASEALRTAQRGVGTDAGDEGDPLVMPPKPPRLDMRV